MILRLQRHLAFIFVIVLNVIYAKSDSTFDCHVTIENIKFDLTSLSGEHVISRTRETPPTTMNDSLRFDVCQDLETLGDLSEQDQVRSALISSTLGSRVPHSSFVAMNFIKSSVDLEQDSV
jgi:Autophagy-related protein 27